MGTNEGLNTLGVPEPEVTFEDLCGCCGGHETTEPFTPRDDPISASCPGVAALTGQLPHRGSPEGVGAALPGLLGRPLPLDAPVD